MDPFASRVKVISPFFWNLETESLRSLSYLLRLTRLLRYFLLRVSSHEEKIERRAIKSNAKNRPSFPRNSHPFSLSSTPRANIPFVTCPLLRRKQSETVEGTEEGRDRKGLVAKVTVPTDSSRKANSREANKPANSFLVCVAYVLPSSSTTCTLHPLPPLPSAHTNEKRRGCVGRRARARTCNSVKRSRYVSRAPVFNVYVSMCACTHACTHVRAARIHARVWRGLVAARLPASALGCAARQDVEPSATQPGDHPRVQPALPPFPSSSVAPTTQATSHYSSSSSTTTTFATVSSFSFSCLREKMREHTYEPSSSLSLRAGRYLFLFPQTRPSPPPDISLARRAQRGRARAAPPAPRKNILQGPSYPPAQGSSPPTAPSHAR